MQNILECEQYLKYCHDQILIGKVIRFISISIKEAGGKKHFLEYLKFNSEKYSDNEYIVATYKANMAAGICYQDPQKALVTIKAIDFIKLNNIDKYIALWILNDQLIYSFYTDEEFSKLNNLFTKITSIATRLNATTDLARVYNTMAGILYKNDIIKAKEYFKIAVYKIIHYEINNILFYFATNYLQLIEKKDDEFNRIVNVLFNWCIKNKDYISSIIKNTNTSLSNNKVFVSLKTFLSLLDKTDDRLSLLLEDELFSNIYTSITAPNSMFNFGTKTFVLF